MIDILMTLAFGALLLRSMTREPASWFTIWALWFLLLLRDIIDYGMSQ